MSCQRLTLLFLLAWLTLPWLWTLVMLLVEPEATCSQVIRFWSRRYPLVPVALGALAAGLLVHWFHEAQE